MTGSTAIAIPRKSSSTKNDDVRWRLVLAHSPTADFFYAVISTHIVCRPNCPSRRPRRANVAFFDSVSAAEAAGFRSCRRCRPQEARSAQPATGNKVATACDYIIQRHGNVQLADIAAHVGLSPRYFHGLFKNTLGTTPGAYTASIRQKIVPQAQGSSFIPAPGIIDGSYDDSWTSLLNQLNSEDLTMPLFDTEAQACLDSPALDWNSVNLDTLLYEPFDDSDLSSFMSATTPTTNFGSGLGGEIPDSVNPSLIQST
ncbi:metal binding domain of Ada-domain-containing protein [Xylariaceae sp. FL0255]|nr:metal binding domain of Ada-domain-containing protein [Xylariaceae sp. FL0255]